MKSNLNEIFALPNSLQHYIYDQNIEIIIDKRMDKENMVYVYMLE
jgi:hypothetical protein